MRTDNAMETAVSGSQSAQRTGCDWRDLGVCFSPHVECSGTPQEMGSLCPSGFCEPTCDRSIFKITGRAGTPAGKPARMPFFSEIKRFGDGGRFGLHMAITEEDRLRCWHLAYREYLACGYTEPQELEYRYSLHDALPDTGTFLVEAAGTAVGTVTVFPDSPLGFPADKIYQEEIGRMRRAGRRPVEVGRLTISDEYKNERTVLTGLFDILSLYSRCVRGATDLVITVNPSHEKFYERMLLFEKIGEQKDFGSVCGAPAVLMRLDLELQKAVIRWEHGEGEKPGGLAGGRTFYKYFSSEAEERAKVERMREVHLPPDGEFVQRYFAWLRPLIPLQSSTVLGFFETCYPGCSRRVA